MRKPTPLPKADRAWLVQLDQKIWKKSHDEIHGDMSMPEKDLSLEEWKKVKRLVAKHQLPCTMSPAVYGTIAFGIYERLKSPEEKPKLLFSVNSQQIPKRRLAQDTDTRWCYNIFGAMANKPANLALLSRYGLEKPKPVGDYYY